MDVQSSLIQLRDDLKKWITNNLKNKVSIEEGKGLSSNDYTDNEKNKLSNISPNAKSVSYTPSLTEGTKVGTISIDGTNTTIYAPTQSKIADSAIKLENARSIALSGDASGSVSFDGTKDVSITVIVNDDSHNHVISNVDGLQSALDGKAASSHGNHVPATETANNAKFLRNDNTWQTVTPANIGALTKNDFSISDGILTLNFL